MAAVGLVRLRSIAVFVFRPTFAVIGERKRR
jgi:hypothetical protein